MPKFTLDHDSSQSLRMANPHQLAPPLTTRAADQPAKSQAGQPLFFGSMIVSQSGRNSQIKQNQTQQPQRVIVVQSHNTFIGNGGQ